MESISRAMCCAERERVPLKTMCSTKWEMPLISAGFAAGAGLDPDAHGDGAQVIHALGQHDQAVGQYGAAEVAFVCHRLPFDSFPGRSDSFARYGTAEETALGLLAARLQSRLRGKGPLAAGLVWMTVGPVRAASYGKCTMLAEAVTGKPTQLDSLDVQAPGK